MAVFRFSVRARDDLHGIGAFTKQRWGAEQAERYLDELETSCKHLADMPGMGRRCDHIRPGLWRMEQGSHVLFFRLQADGILICRILHEHMLPEHHPIDDDDENNDDP